MLGFQNGTWANFYLKLNCMGIFGKNLIIWPQPPGKRHAAAEQLGQPWGWAGRSHASPPLRSADRLAQGHVPRDCIYYRRRAARGGGGRAGRRLAALRTHVQASRKGGTFSTVTRISAEFGFSENVCEGKKVAGCLLLTYCCLHVKSFVFKEKFLTFKSCISMSFSVKMQTFRLNSSEGTWVYNSLEHDYPSIAGMLSIEKK